MLNNLEPRARQSVKREETWGVSLKSYTGRGVTKQRRVVEFTRSDPRLLLPLLNARALHIAWKVYPTFGGWVV